MKEKGSSPIDKFVVKMMLFVVQIAGKNNKRQFATWAGERTLGAISTEINIIQRVLLLSS